MSSATTSRFSSAQLKTISLIAAATGLLYELALSQLLFANFGNTFLRYTSTVGIFTLTLGITSLVYDQFSAKIHRTNFFIASQFCIAVVGVLSPLWVQWMDPISATSEFGRFALGATSYLPMVLIGLLSGYELPFLLHESPSSSKSRILAFDYFGMFLAAVLFPIFFFPLLGVLNLIFLLAFINVLMGFYVFFSRKAETA